MLGVVAAADDAAVVVRRAVEVTAEAEPLQPQHAQPAAGREPGGRAAHSAEADDDHVGVDARRRPITHGRLARRPVGGSSIASPITRRYQRPMSAESSSIGANQPRSAA